ncbi:transcription factor E2F7-like isoform X2 [Watersipora subatra]|uniref:transcription factor E2F7-like isoform X2 n=1 Tax=Watersipora subatra TaxID=2589382 RepID=UPI00355C285F
MGKRKEERKNIENIEPSQELFLHDTSLKYPCKMKTRSKKGSSTKLTPVTDPVAYPTATLLQEIAQTASTVDSTNIVSQQSASLDSSDLNCNEVTPKKQLGSTATPAVDLGAVATRATPTANLKILCDAVDHDETVCSESQITQGVTGDEPVTPTTNLKVLINAASPEIRSLELSKSRLFTDEDEEEEDEFDHIIVHKSTKVAAAATRKQKSLGILCRRFMSQFDEKPPKTTRIEVCLDELASHLGTERRRIYDIVNVLESVEIMSRRAKNRYLWHGMTNLNATLVKLKHYAEGEKVAKQLELIKELEVARLYGRKCRSDGSTQSEYEAVLEHPKYRQYMDQFGDSHKKERSLGVLSQKFLMLFLTGRTKTINLDMAAKILLGDPMVETKQTNSQFKTKIRRLYDIANILASINLICKVHVTELRGRKPAFSYIGPDVEELSTLEEYKYLRGVEVARPGRTTLDMKMEELKRKMDAHIAAEKAALTSTKQVPPVTVEAPDLEEIRRTMSGTDKNLSKLAAEHIAKKVKQRLIAPAPPSTHRPFVVIQGIAGGPTSVVTTSQAPNFMEANQVTNVVTSASQDQYSTISLLPVIQAEGNQYVVTGPIQQSPIAVSLLNTSPTPGSAVRTILPQSSTTQTRTLYTPPSKEEAEASPQQKRTLSDSEGQTVHKVSDGNRLQKSKKLKMDSDVNMSEVTIAEDIGCAQSLQTEVVCCEMPGNQVTTTPVPLIYSTPSDQHGVPVSSTKNTNPITATHIAFIASPVVTPQGTDSVAAASPGNTKPRAAIRQLLLSPKQPSL